MADQGYLLIADISGYTGFLTQSELEHAHDIMRNLIDSLTQHMKAPLVIAKLEGDAIFCYALTRDIRQPQTLVEITERLYTEFRAARDLMVRNTTCTCSACRRIPTLDLKFVVHRGEFIRSQIAGREELTGSDVILIHRLLKNTVKEDTHVDAYAYFTGACELGEVCQAMLPHTENYEHIGDVQGSVLDLHPVWEREHDVRRVRVQEAESMLHFSVELPIPPVMVWDYLTRADIRGEWQQIGMTVTNRQRGRIAAGSNLHCYHNNQVVDFLIVDWRPFEYFTQECSFSMGYRVAETFELTPTGNGTTLRYYINRGRAPNPIAENIVRLMAKRIYSQLVPPSLARLCQTVERDLANGTIQVHTAVPAVTA